MHGKRYRGGELKEDEGDKKVSPDEVFSEVDTHVSHSVSGPVVAFFSGSTDLFPLSNFALLDDPVEYDGIMYHTLEHARQAQKFVENDRDMFSITGEIGSWDFDRAFRKVELTESKQAYWMRKSNYGIVAKMAANPRRAKSLGLTFCNSETFENLDAMWLQLLRQKYARGRMRDMLIGTGNAYLLEMDRRAQKQGSFFGGFFDKNENRVHGNNYMGKLLMQVRQEIIDSTNGELTNP